MAQVMALLQMALALFAAAGQPNMPPEIQSQAMSIAESAITLAQEEIAKIEGNFSPTPTQSSTTVQVPIQQGDTVTNVTVTQQTTTSVSGAPDAAVGEVEVLTPATVTLTFGSIDEGNMLRFATTEKINSWSLFIFNPADNTYSLIETPIRTTLYADKYEPGANPRWAYGYTFSENLPRRILDQTYRIRFEDSQNKTTGYFPVQEVR